MSENTRTVGRMFLERVKKSTTDNAVGWFEDGSIKFISYNEYKSITQAISMGLQELGVGTDSKVSILSNTRKEWNYCDFGILFARGVTIPIYQTYTSEEVKYIFNHSDSKVIIVENDEQIEKVIKVQNDLPNLQHLIYFDKPNESNLSKIKDGVNVLSYDDLYNLGLKANKDKPDFYEKNILDQKEDELASIIYTSGTTGEPKGAVITQRALATMLLNVEQRMGPLFNTQDRTLTWLPLSHVFGRCESLLGVVLGWEMVFAEGVDQLMSNLATAKPTVLLAVPRIFEKIYAKIMDQVNSGSPVKRALFNWAKHALTSYHDKLNEDLSPTTAEIIQAKLAYKLVFSKVYEKFGGRVRYFISGGAPISIEIIKFLRCANLVIVEGYGLTETVAPCCVNPPEKQIPGTVGTPLGDVQIKIADDGEILIKSEAMLSEYYKNPEATAEAIKDGWFYSGDIGEFESSGYLKITDRKKDIIITSGGKNVAPQKIENMLKLKKHISQSVVIGDKRKYLTVLIGIEKEPFLDDLVEMGLPEDCSLEDIAKHEKTKSIIEEYIEEVNEELASFESIKKFHIIPEEFTVDNGFITPSLKVRKKNIMKAYDSAIDAMY